VRARRNKQKPASAVDVMRARVASVIAHTRGTLPITMACRSQAEAALARPVLDGRKGGELVRVVIAPERDFSPRVIRD